MPPNGADSCMVGQLFADNLALLRGFPRPPPRNPAPGCHGRPCTPPLPTPTACTSTPAFRPGVCHPAGLCILSTSPAGRCCQQRQHQHPPIYLSTRGFLKIPQGLNVTRRLSWLADPGAFGGRGAEPKSGHLTCTWPHPKAVLGVRSLLINIPAS